MRIIQIDLSKQYPFLAGDSDAVLTAYLQQDIVDSEYMDVFRRPALLICPGGAYRWCSSREAEPVALAFAPLGFNCFVLRYSVAPRRWPTALREVAAAVDIIHQNAEPWNIDAGKIAICGFSAGGHLAASYCTGRDLAEITSVIEPKPVQAAVLSYPVITAKEQLRHLGSFQELLGIQELTPELEEKFSLERHVDAKLTPPTFLWHTAADGSVPVENSLLYAQALAQKDIPFELPIFPAGRHGLATSDRQTLRDYAAPEHLRVSQWVPLAQNWLKQTMEF